MSRAAETLDQRRFTVDEYHRMAETGIFEPNERVELNAKLCYAARRVAPRVGL